MLKTLKWKKAESSLLSLMFGALALVGSSCGGSDSSFAPIDTTTGGLGTGVAPVGSCAQRGGFITQYPTPHCRLVQDFKWTFGGFSFPYLTPSNPAGLSAAPSAGQAFYVRPGDRLVFHASSSSGWGSSNTET